MTTQVIPLESLSRSDRQLVADRYLPLKNVVPEADWDVHAPYVAAIERLKVERNAVVIAHNYQAPEVFHGVAVGQHADDLMHRDARAFDMRLSVQDSVVNDDSVKHRHHLSSQRR